MKLIFLLFCVRPFIWFAAKFHAMNYKLFSSGPQRAKNSNKIKAKVSWSMTNSKIMNIHVYKRPETCADWWCCMQNKHFYYDIGRTVNTHSITNCITIDIVCECCRNSLFSELNAHRCVWPAQQSPMSAHADAYTRTSHTRNWNAWMKHCEFFPFFAINDWCTYNYCFV